MPSYVWERTTAETALMLKEYDFEPEAYYFAELDPGVQELFPSVAREIADEEERKREAELDEAVWHLAKQLKEEEEDEELRRAEEDDE